MGPSLTIARVPTSTDSSHPRLRLSGITKRFPGVLANDAVSLEIAPGEIHALLGENGAGKSTLVKIIDGLYQADEGEIAWEGKPVTVSGPKAARALGIGMVFQHFSLFEALSVAENIALGLSAPPPLKQMNSLIERVSAEYGLGVEPERAVHTLSVGERQRVEIVRALLERPRLLIMDEPTSVLTPREVDKLFEVLRQIKAEGCSILYISHKLHEIAALCDRATVMRAGRVVAECNPVDETPASLARMMMGEDIDVPVRADGGLAADARPVLAVQRLSLVSDERFGVDLDSVTFEARAGEVFGIAGIAGNGQTELLAALAGEQLAADASTIRINDADVGRVGPRARRSLGLACIPEDRLGHGAVPLMSLTENAFLSAFVPKALTHMGLVLTRARDDYARKIVEEFDVRTTGIRAPAESLSGGNLQKFITGRELEQQPAVLIAAQPTWGVDAGAAAAIHKALMALARSGAAVVVISQELDELLTISDRIAVIAAGRLSEARPPASFSREAIGMLMAGKAQAGEAQGGAVVKDVVGA